MPEVHLQIKIGQESGGEEGKGFPQGWCKTELCPSSVMAVGTRGPGAFDLPSVIVTAVSPLAAVK